MTTLHQTGASLTAYAKGAPEVVLASCITQATASGVQALDAGERQRILATAQEMAGNALRVLAIAAKPEAVLETAAQEMTFLGLAGMIDPPRPEAKAAIALCADAGIRPVMITGDHPVTAQAVARELGCCATAGAL